MRIIGGNLKGRRLFSPKDKNIRPTSDRIKETIFNILATKVNVDGSMVLDLFCGSGALAIEALSRGALNAVFIDNNSESIKLTKMNLAAAGFYPPITAKYNGAKNNMGATDGNTKGNNAKLENGDVEVYNTGFDMAIKKLQGKKFDIIFMDPPYFDNLEQQCLFLINKYGILAESGIIVYEHFTKNGLSQETQGYIIDTRNFGSVSVSFLSNKREERK